MEYWNSTFGSNNMFFPEQWTTKMWADTCLYLMQMYLISHTTVMIAPVAYHRLYNRPASPLSCLCSSSCSSPLLNENKSGVDTLQQEIKEHQLRKDTECYSSQAGPGELLLQLLACMGGKTPYANTSGASLAAPKLYPVPSPRSLYHTPFGFCPQTLCLVHMLMLTNPCCFST